MYLRLQPVLGSYISGVENNKKYIRCTSVRPCAGEELGRYLLYETL